MARTVGAVGEAGTATGTPAGDVIRSAVPTERDRIRSRCRPRREDHPVPHSRIRSPRASRAVMGPALPGPATLWASGGRRALTAGLCAALPLAVGLALGRPDLGSAAGLGGFTAIYGHPLPFRRPARGPAGVGAGLAVAGPAGALSGLPPVVLSLVCGLLAAAAAAATAVWRIGPPGPIGAILVGGGASALGTVPGELPAHLLATAAGAALAWAACMLPWLWDPAGPERRAVAAADAAVAGAERGALTTAGAGAVARAVRLADAAVADTTRRGGPGHRATLAARGGRGPPPPAGAGGAARAVRLAAAGVADPPRRGGPGHRATLAARLEEVEERFLRALPFGDVPEGTAPPPEPVAGPGAPPWWGRV